MKISVAVLVHHEGDSLGSCLDSLLEQRSLEYLAEIIIVANAATEETWNYIRQWKQFDRPVAIRILVNEDNNLARARNLAIAACESEYLAFLDGDCIAPRTWLGSIWATFLSYSSRYPELAAVGGGASAVARTNFAQSLAHMQRNILGHMNSPQARPIPCGIEVDHVPTLNVLYKVSALREVKGFDEHFSFVCEDVEIGYRLRSCGYRLLLVPECAVKHYARDCLRDWAARMWRFGFGQTLVMRKHKAHIQVRTLLPLLFLPTMFFSLVLGMLWQPILLLLPLMYLSVVVAVALYVANRQEAMAEWRRIAFAYVLTHYCYAWGEWQGVLTRQFIARE